ncbi:MAG: hypothetical protein DMF56_01345 [Acidobacteria bacterium]|nr:MAG: hypothetical protein DMF56_01345 [Acidobacteriota bacterium]
MKFVAFSSMTEIYASVTAQLRWIRNRDCIVVWRVFVNQQALGESHIGDPSLPEIAGGMSARIVNPAEMNHDLFLIAEPVLMLAEPPAECLPCGLSDVEECVGTAQDVPTVDLV